jgi:hypothetical protein
LGVNPYRALLQCCEDGVAGADTWIWRCFNLNTKPIKFDDESLCPTERGKACCDLATNLASWHLRRCTIRRRDWRTKERYACTDKQNAQECRADEMVRPEVRVSCKER